MMNLTNQNENFTKNQNEPKEQENLRKAFCFRKKTNKTFSRLKSGQKNKLLIKAILQSLERYKNENLFFHAELVEFLDDKKRI